MNIQFYNTLTNRLEPFEPLEPPKVLMYTCGPTVYDFSHIGNFKTFLFADVFRRFLQLTGYNVHQVMNITDVGHMTDDDVADATGEDKMATATMRVREAKKAGTLPDDAIGDPDDPYQIARYYTDAFLEDARALGIQVAYEYPENMPHATQHIDAMHSMIRALLDNGHAYVADDGVVYFSVQSFPEYGTLSGNSLDNLIEGSGGRVLSEHQAHKKHPADFFLWKPDEHHIMKWDSPWGPGYPGWHIECSAMSMKLLGRKVLDIHTGGEDNIFPHHECELAQSCCATGNPQFARLWMHPRFLLVEGKKMSKSKGTFYTPADVYEGKVTGRPVHPSVLRFELIKTHYRTQTNFTQKGILDSANTVRRFNEFTQKVAGEADNEPAEIDNTHPVLKDFTEALADDLNMSVALAVVHAWLGQDLPDPHEALAVSKAIDSVLGITSQNGTADNTDLKAICDQIDKARSEKDYDTADRLRDELIEQGYEIRTTPEGTVAQKKLA